MKQQPNTSARVSEPGKQPITLAGVPSKDRLYCAIKLPPRPIFGDDVSVERAIIVEGAKKRWVNGAVLHYYLFDDSTEGSTIELSDHTTEWRTWAGAPEQKAIVRWAFAAWKASGIGLDFQEVTSRNAAEIRIGFQLDGGSWSRVGREDILDLTDVNQRTMNFGWNLTDAYGHDTALHEIGHTLGLMHEHQSPFSGIVWNNEAVYAAFGEGTSNNWCPQKIYDNILSKTDPSSVTGSEWDVNSVMEYQFGSGLVIKPQPYDTTGIHPTGGLSPLDIAWICKAYPPLAPVSDNLNLAKVEPLNVVNGAQRDFIVQPSHSGPYTVEALGRGDTLLALFENNNGALWHVKSDDDSGEERNAKLQVNLQKGQQYVLRAKQIYNEDLSKPVQLALKQN